MAEDLMEAPGARSIERLPEELVEEVIALTTPFDAGRATAVSRAFRAAALSDPDRPVLLAKGLVSMWVDRETGARCYMLSARALSITWSCTPQYWRWISLSNNDSRFPEAAELLEVCWLLIRGRMHSDQLSRNTTYAAYMVFKVTDESFGLRYPLQEASVSIGGRTSTRKVCIHPYDNVEDEEDEDEEEEEEDEDEMMPPLEDNVALPQKRAGDWMELEMGEFYNDQGDDGEVTIRLDGRQGGDWKGGLIVQGIEIRAKK